MRFWCPGRRTPTLLMSLGTEEGGRSGRGEVRRGGGQAGDRGQAGWFSPPPHPVGKCSPPPSKGSAAAAIGIPCREPLEIRPSCALGCSRAGGLLPACPSLPKGTFSCLRKWGQERARSEGCCCAPPPPEGLTHSLVMWATFSSAS